MDSLPLVLEILLKWTYTSKVGLGHAEMRDHKPIIYQNKPCPMIAKVRLPVFYQAYWTINVLGQLDHRRIPQCLKNRSEIVVIIELGYHASNKFSSLFKWSILYQYLLKYQGYFLECPLSVSRSESLNDKVF